MNKIPIFGTISRAYGFLIGDFGTIVRLTWAPLLAAAALQYYFGGEIMDAALRTVQTSDPTRMTAAQPAQYLLGLVQFVAGVIALVALLRVVIFGDRKPGLFVYFWFGSAEIRIVVVSVLLLIATIAAFFGVTIVLVILAALASQLPVLGVVLAVAIFALFFVVIWVALRLALINPVIVAESGLGVERSWALMHGNALRLFVIFLFTFLPLAVLSIFVFMVIMGTDFPPFPDFLGMMKQAGSRGQSSTGAQDAIREAMQHWQVALVDGYHKHWPELCTFGFVYSLISTALAAGATGSAYVSATGKNG